MISLILRSLIGLAIVVVMINIVRANMKSYEESHVDKGKRFAEKVEQLHNPTQTAQQGQDGQPAKAAH